MFQLDKEDFFAGNNYAKFQGYNIGGFLYK